MRDVDRVVTCAVVLVRDAEDVYRRVVRRYRDDVEIPLVVECVLEIRPDDVLVDVLIVDKNLRDGR
jgi:hypothetical protein